MAEQRLIDANALIEEIGYEYDLNYGEILTDPCRFADMVEDAPTVDAVEVVHGRWEDVALRYTQVKEKCSVCGGIVYAHGYNFCPNCGAKMYL